MRLNVGSIIRVRRTDRTIQKATIIEVYGNKVGVYWDETEDSPYPYTRRIAKMVDLRDIEPEDFKTRLSSFILAYKYHIPWVIIITTIIVDIIQDFFDKDKHIICTWGYISCKREATLTKSIISVISTIISLLFGCFGRWIGNFCSNFLDSFSTFNRILIIGFTTTSIACLVYFGGTHVVSLISSFF